MERSQFLNIHVFAISEIVLSPLEITTFFKLWYSASWSKHDLSLSSVNGGFPVSPTIIRKTNGELNQEADHVVLPSKEAPSRLLIGTKMLQGSQSNKYLTNNTPSYTLQSPFQSDTNGRNYCSKGVKTTDDVKLKKSVVRITKYCLIIICKISNIY